MLERGGKKHETEIKVRCFNDKGKPYKPKYDEWIAFDDAGRLRPLPDGGGGDDDANSSSNLMSDDVAPPPPQLPELWLALAARFEAVGGLTTDGIFRESANKDTLDECESRLFSSSGVDADGTTAREILAPLTDSHVSTHTYRLALRCVQSEPRLRETHVARVVCIRQLLAGLISRWLRSRGLARIPAEHHATCAAYAVKGASSDPTSAAHEVQEIISQVEATSPPTALLLKAVIELLQRVDPEATQMTAKNLGVMFGPTLIHREDPQDFAKHGKVCCCTSAAAAIYLSHSCLSFWVAQ